MGYRGMDPDRTGVDDARDYVIYTVEAIAVARDEEVRKLGKVLAAILEEFTALEQARVTAHRRVVRANACVRGADGFGDDTLSDFSHDVLAEVRQDRSAPLYVSFFPDAPNEVIALSLAPEIEVFERLQAVMETAPVPAPLKKKYQPLFREVVAQGRKALEERRVAMVAETEAWADLGRWIERADRARLALHGALTTWGAQNGRARDFADRFFPAASGGTRKKAKTPAPAPPPGPEGPGR